MCGICGTVGRADKNQLRAMCRIMAHRGPDGEGVELFRGRTAAGLGHRRLAIIDPSPAGAQPMSFGDRYWITYNGELYNFAELRDELRQKGQRFRSDSDTEVVLAMFSRYGPAMLSRLNGIFAFAIWDVSEEKLFICRDRLGVKPLYWTRQDGVFAFASEVKPLLPFLRQVELDPNAVADFLTFLWVPEPQTAFRGIEQLPAGHYAWVDERGMHVDQYWDLRFAPEERPEGEWADAVRETVTRSVRRQMVSDVPLGGFLSGGIDSSAVVAAMAARGDVVSTYTIGFDREDLKHEIAPDDLKYARQVGAQLGTDYHEELLQPDVLNLLPLAVWHLEEPVADPAAISTYLICRAAGRRMPVMLSGMGADEIFAGYPRYLAQGIGGLLDRAPNWVRQGLEAAASPVARPGQPGRLRGPRRNLWKFMRASGLGPLERFLSFSTYYATNELMEVLTPDLRSRIGDHDPLGRHRAYLATDVGGDDLSRLLYLDSKTFLPSLNLKYTDKMGMAASVEVRVPLLDDELIDLAARIPSNLKLKAWRRKYIFKKSQEGLLPQQVVWRKKAGFGAPVRSWLSGELAPLADELLSDRTIRSRGLVRPEVVRSMRNEHAAGRADYGLRLYALLSLEVWCRTFVDRSWRFEDLVSPYGRTNSEKSRAGAFR